MATTAINAETYALDLARNCDNATGWLAGWDASRSGTAEEHADGHAAARAWETWQQTAGQSLTIEQVQAVALAMGWPAEMLGEDAPIRVLDRRDWPEPTATCEHGTGYTGACDWYALPGAVLTYSTTQNWAIYPVVGFGADEFYDLPDVPDLPALADEVACRD